MKNFSLSVSLPPFKMTAVSDHFIYIHVALPYRCRFAILPKENNHPVHLLIFHRKLFPISTDLFLGNTRASRLVIAAAFSGKQSPDDLFGHFIDILCYFKIYQCCAGSVLHNRHLQNFYLAHCIFFDPV